MKSESKEFERLKIIIDLSSQVIREQSQRILQIEKRNTKQKKIINQLIELNEESQKDTDSYNDIMKEATKVLRKKEKEFNI